MHHQPDEDTARRRLTEHAISRHGGPRAFWAYVEKRKKPPFVVGEEGFDMSESMGKDPYVGERYADKDPRSKGRIVRVLERVADGRYGPTYLVEVEVHPTAPNAVGHHSALMARTLDTRYRKVSH